MMVLIRTWGKHTVAEDAPFVMNDEAIVEWGEQDALLEVPDNFTEAQINDAIAGGKRFTGRHMILHVLEPKEEELG
jgi:hypothetical protein